MLGPIACVIARRPIARGEEVLSLSLESGYLDEGGSFPIQKTLQIFSKKNSNNVGGKRNIVSRNEGSKAVWIFSKYSSKYPETIVP